jgi:hypothetical protein
VSGRPENGTGFVYYDTLGETGVVWMNRQTRPVQPAQNAAEGLDAS